MKKGFQVKNEPQLDRTFAGDHLVEVVHVHRGFDFRGGKFTTGGGGSGIDLVGPLRCSALT
ncbi:conserved hypothetical protein [Ricinus communis]|uniref:Uncharacterized protein n=1 Tax=Ricinus communis TaxID=3988 RepID=B9R9E6_RICCO|nr:conserved hypothetical protein [Ricinus communis]